MKAAFAFIFTFSFIVFANPAAAQDKLSGIFFDIQKGLTHLLVQTRKLGDSTLTLDAVDLQKNMNTCLNSIMNHSYALDSSYIAEFRNYSDLLNDPAQAATQTSATKLVHFLNEDLKLKYQVTSGEQNSVPKLVEVRVRVYKTVQNKNILLNGYHVFAKPELSLNDQSKIEFNPTDFSVKHIPRGAKKFWIEENHIKIDSTVTSIGLHLAARDSVIFMINGTTTNIPIH